MDEETMQEWFMEVLNTIDDPDESPCFNIATKRVRTFEDVGLLTSTKGLRVQFTDGSECLLSIQKSR